MKLRDPPHSLTSTGPKTLRKQKGFSLIELLIVVAIILVIAAIAIPNLLRSKIAANESSAVGSLRSINTAQVAYYSSSASYNGPGGDAESGYAGGRLSVHWPLEFKRLPAGQRPGRQYAWRYGVRK